MKQMSEAHEFAFYTDDVSKIRAEALLDTFELTDSELVYRISVVLRLGKGEQLVLFNAQYHVIATIASIESRRHILFHILSFNKNKQLVPAIHWLLPLLKKEAFEEALYTLTELGATTVQPVITRKTTRFWSGEKEVSRARKIMIAAAEQSKQFVIPHLHPIIPLELWLLQPHPENVKKIFFDAQGMPLKEVIDIFEQKGTPNIIACAGPEGDLTGDEKQLLADHGFLFCALTPTILRAQQAVAVGLGSLRSFLSEKSLW